MDKNFPQAENRWHAPPFLLAVSFIYWGWECSLFTSGILLAVVAELPRLVRTRWDFKMADMARINDICTLSVIGVMVYHFAMEPEEALAKTIVMMPLFLFPLLLAQLFSVQGIVDIRALFLVARKSPKRVGREKRIDLTFPYVALCLMAAGTSNNRSHGYFIAIAVVCGIALFVRRPKRYSPILWGSVFFLACLAGMVLHPGLVHLQKKLTHMAIDMFITDYADPFQRRTAIGDIGELKMSDRIIFRVEPDPGAPTSYLLREASYNHYSKGVWYAVRASFQDVPRTGQPHVWKLGEPARGKQHSLRIFTRLSRGKGLLRLPLSVTHMEDLKVPTLRQNNFGAVKVMDGPEFLSFRAYFHSGASFDEPPGQQDLLVPSIEQEVIMEKAQELNLTSMDPKQAIQILKQFFRNNFTYTLTHAVNQRKPDLKEFLTKWKAGHCEYFAATTVLLLRAAGIPARYVSGYSAHEQSPFENRIIVRMKHAHAWAQAYVNNNWINVDTTPPDWQVRDKSHPLLSFFPDLMSIVSFWVAWLRWEEGGVKQYTLWLLIPLAFIVFRRVREGKNIKKKQITPEVKKPEQDHHHELAGLFSAIEEILKKQGFERALHETWPVFLTRIQKHGMIDYTVTDLQGTVAEYYKERFSSKGLSQSSYKELRQQIMSIINSLENI